MSAARARFSSHRARVGDAPLETVRRAARQTLAAISSDRVQLALPASPNPDDVDGSTEQHLVWIDEFADSFERMFDAPDCPCAPG